LSEPLMRVMHVIKDDEKMKYGLNLDLLDYRIHLIILKIMVIL
jgi:hypothetical protein